VEHFQEVFTALRGADVSLKANKSHLFQEEVEYLGDIVRRGEQEVQKKPFCGLKEASPLRWKEDLRSFPGMCNVYWRFFRDYAQVARPLADDEFQEARSVEDGVIRGVWGVRGAQQAAHGGTHPRPTAASGSLHVDHGRKRVAGRRGPTIGTTRSIHAARGLLESLP